MVGVEREQRDGAHAFRAVRGPAGRQQRVLFCNNNYGNVGLLWKGDNVEKFPPEGTYGYRTSPLASSVVRTSVTVRNVIGQVNTDYCLTGTVNAGGKP